MPSLAWPDNGRIFFPGLPDNASVRDALAINPEAGRLLSHYHQQVLRGNSQLTVAERELIATYVSALNRCNFCFHTHAVTARLFGVDAAILEALEDGGEPSMVPDRLKPILVFAKQLTLNHGSMTKGHVQAVLDAGWSREALHDVILVTCMFNFMNRFVHGHGIEGEDHLWEDRGRYLYQNGYSAIVDSVRATPADREKACEER
jgi:uncharacterized peroxidase-related enzyme